MSEHCVFGTILNNALRDYFVIGLRGRTIQHKLLSNEMDIKSSLDTALVSYATYKQVK